LNGVGWIGRGSLQAGIDGWYCGVYTVFVILSTQYAYEKFLIKHAFLTTHWWRHVVALV